MQLVSKISNLCDADPPTLQTDGQIDGQTDGQHAISIPRYALVHRAVKTDIVNWRWYCRCEVRIRCLRVTLDNASDYRTNGLLSTYPNPNLSPLVRQADSLIHC